MVPTTVQPGIRDIAADEVRRFEGFENLMPFRVENILLVSSFYDSFILQEDGRLSELFIGDFVELNLHHVPGITHVSSGTEALALATQDSRFNLIIANLHLGDMTAAQLAADIKRAGLDVPVVVLAYDYAEVKQFVLSHPATDIERIFLWQGNIRILATIVKYIEDKKNAACDTRAIGVPVILVVEDNIRYYSSFLPVIYTELISQSRRLLSEGVNVAHKLMRMRARPKILLCTNYEDAMEQVMLYREYLFGVVSDIEFPRHGVLDPDCGFALGEVVHGLEADVPVILQSSRTEFMEKAHALGFPFLRKGSPTLLDDLRHFLIERLGFGDFVFRLKDGVPVARAKNLDSLETLLAEIPSESIAYHAERNHFSRWMMARTEFALAEKLRPRRLSDFTDIEHLRRDLIESIAGYRRQQSLLLIRDFDAASFRPEEALFARIGGGSLGGKARGLAFVRHLLYRQSLSDRFPGIRIAVPPTLVLATDVFDQFVRDNDLLGFAIRSEDEGEIERRFLSGVFPPGVRESLLHFLEQVQYPLAVRSSSLLEDSQYRPFTGVYKTYMLPNHQGSPQERLQELLQAIQRVYASTFSMRAKTYVKATPYRLEEEKMAVIIQQLVGSVHGDHFYPLFSGVARSRNFYPVSPATSSDGIAAVALGLGRTVVDGGRCFTFCPRYPRHLLQLSSVDDLLANSQTDFWAVDLSSSANSTAQALAPSEIRLELDVAGKDGVLPLLASTYSPDDHALYDGVSRAGTPVITFAGILKHGAFPLSPILEQLLKTVEEGLGRPVEIEFAARFPKEANEPAIFAFLQMRPLAPTRTGEDHLRVEDIQPSRILCRSSKVLGYGQVSDLHDIVAVDFHRFERGRSFEVAQTISLLNNRLTREERPYLLIGVGRWGSNDPWLGVPVTWEQVAGARVIVEAGFRDLRVTPSQGSHFFQNLNAFQVAYFTVNPDLGEGLVDWDWLASLPAVDEIDSVRHVQLEKPLEIVVSGKTGVGLIVKPTT